MHTTATAHTRLPLHAYAHVNQGQQQPCGPTRQGCRKVLRGGFGGGECLQCFVAPQQGARGGGGMTCWRCRACAVLSHLNHGWTGESTRGGGPLLYDDMKLSHDAWRHLLLPAICQSDGALGFRCSGHLWFICHLVGSSERRPQHVTEELFSLIFALHLCFVTDGTGRAHASVSRSGGLRVRAHPPPPPGPQDPQPIPTVGKEEQTSQRARPPRTRGPNPPPLQPPNFPAFRRLL